MTNSSLSNNDKSSWYCVKVQPRKEIFVMKNLNFYNIENYLPIIKYDYKKNSSLVLKEELLFPGYIFVKIDLSTQKKIVSYCKGVSHIISFNNECMIISENIIRLIKTYLHENKEKNPIKSLRIGDKVIISNGALNGNIVKISSILPSFDRVKVLLNLIGINVEVEIPSDSLERNHSGVVIV